MGVGVGAAVLVVVVAVVVTLMSWDLVLWWFARSSLPLSW